MKLIQEKVHVVGEKAIAPLVIQSQQPPLHFNSVGIMEILQDKTEHKMKC